MHPGERIREIRKRKGLTLKEFARPIRYSYVHVSNIERGSLRPSRDFLVKLSEIYGISSDYVLYGTLQTNVLRNGNREYNADEAFRERRLSKNIPKRRLIDKVIKILDSGNKKAVKALRSNIDAFLSMIEPRKSEIKEGD